MMEKIAYAILIFLALIWLGAMVVGMISAWPVGWLVLLGLGAIGLLFIKVLKERLRSSEDDHYSKTVDK